MKHWYTKYSMRRNWNLFYLTILLSSLSYLKWQSSTNRRLVKKGGKAIPQALIKWMGLPDEAATREDWYVLQARFPGCLTRGPRALGEGRGECHVPNANDILKMDIYNYAIKSINDISFMSLYCGPRGHIRLGYNMCHVTMNTILNLKLKNKTLRFRVLCPHRPNPLLLYLLTSAATRHRPQVCQSWMQATWFLCGSNSRQSITI